MGANEKSQRPRKRKLGALGGKNEEGPPPRVRKRTGGPLGAPKDGPVPVVEEDEKEKARREELAALETFLFGAPTSEAPGDAEAPKEAGALVKKRKKKRRAENSSKNVDAAVTPLTEAETAEPETAGGGGPPRPAWTDPEDRRLFIDIEANPKLRKLRQKKGEKLLTGEEYQKRLQGLQSKLVGQRQGLQWIQQARLRKAQVDTQPEG